ncbi:FKBP-type peptidyl-prolyl cis-trans isomerase [Cellulomonas citrea]|uniref:FKBP-type peptidyl-prolyl cis-trans isomerase n=1 Tax=Cellulomonas citrea TaxID=1909423 RepID=UPI001F272A22|nr:FKBP-type peptidyl-prolyl cis-trans isomerase [Cellulomonas citrea]
MRGREWRRAVGLAVGAVLATGSLVACSTGTQAAPVVDVTGVQGQAPTVTYVAPLDVGHTYRRTIWAGTGPELVDGGPVLLDFWLENATDASVVKETYTDSPATRTLSEEDLGVDLYQSLRGQRVGARVLQVAPGASSGSTTYPTVTVLDVLPLRADGQAVAPVPDLPAVALADDGAPSITPSSAPAPTTLVAQPLKKGAGAQVGAQDVVTFQYAGFAWTTGEEFDSSWARGAPVSHSLLDLSQAFTEGLVEQTVGSQIELVVPPTYPLGVTAGAELSGQTVVFVVDILATRTPTQKAAG